MGFKRKRDGHHDFRPRLSPTEMLVARLRPAIAQIGEPSRYAREGLMRSLMHDLGEVPESNFPEILQTLKAVIYEQPHKIGYLSFVIAGAPSHVSFIVLEMAHDEAVKALSAGDYIRFKLFFRFLCALHPIIANPEVLTDCMSRLLTFDTDNLDLKNELYKTALLASLYLPQSALSAQLREQFLGVDLKDRKGTDFFTGEAKPYTTKYTGEILLEAARRLHADDWKVEILASNPLKVPISPDLMAGTASTTAAADTGSTALNGNDAKEAIAEEDGNYEPAGGTMPADSDVQRDPEPTEPEETNEASNKPIKEPIKVEEPSEPKHVLHAIHIPSPAPTPINRFHAPAYFRCYMPLEGNVDTVPSESSVTGILLRDVAVDTIRHMDFNRREVTRQLIALDVFFSPRVFAPPGAWLDQITTAAQEGKPTWKVEDIALEAIFSQMFDLENTAQLPHVYYHSLLIEACVMAPQDIAPVLGRGLRFLFNSLESSNAELLFTLVDWFSHHVSNFAFTWKWNEWKDALSLAPDHPQLVFIKELLAKEVRLSYPQRVRDILPEEFQFFVPTPPDMPPFKYADDEVGEELLNLLRGAEYEQAKTLLLEKLEDSKKRTDLLLHSVCHLGNRSVTHATTWIGKTEDLIKEFAPKDSTELASHAVNAVFDHWSQAPWVGSLVINQLIRAQLLNSATLVEYIVSHRDLLLSSTGWETLLTYVAEAKAAIQGLKLDGEFGEWWATGLQKALARLATQAEKKAAEEAERHAREAEKAAKDAEEAEKAAKEAAKEAEIKAIQEAEKVAEKAAKEAEQQKATEEAESAASEEQKKPPTDEAMDDTLTEDVKMDTSDPQDAANDIQDITKETNNAESNNENTQDENAQDENAHDDSAPDNGEPQPKRQKMQ